MSDLMKRITKWTAKTNPERVKSTLEELRTMMINNIQTTFPELVMLEAQVRQVLDGESLSLRDYPFYLAFAREVWSKERNGLSGGSLSREVAVLIQKWVGRGLSQTILERIRNEVFSIAPPGP